MALIHKFTGNIQESTLSGLTAGTTQTQGGGYHITADLNEFSTVANVNDSATLISAFPGARQTIINNGANTMQIFPNVSDDLGAGVNTATTLAAGGRVVYKAYNTSDWAVV